jgi:hypothetical protein
MPPAPADAPSADALVQAVIDSERWIHGVTSFQARFEGESIMTPEGMARRRAKRERERPGETGDEWGLPEWRTRDTDDFAVGFNGHRLYQHFHLHDKYEQVRFWDGARTVAHDTYHVPPVREHHTTETTPKLAAFGLLSHMSWPRAGAHEFWWGTHVSQREPRNPQEARRRRREWDVVGREMYRGVDCWVLEQELSVMRWYVGVGRPLLHGMVGFCQYEEAVAKALAAERGAPGLETREDFERWFLMLSTAEREDVMEQAAHRILQHAHPSVEFFLLEYAELSPGRWFPMTQGIDSYDCETSPAIRTGTRVLKATDVRINEPLPADWFVDHHDPALH